ncbi:MAG: hypothetical protein HOI23_19850 [Deltaproteobacteria bacterium]|nr:hypothetical protein [Deltaproteobacteria bacterium]MBT6489539.1 hypothetical protein [Deltaproteobacteria bacterium]
MRLEYLSIGFRLLLGFFWLIAAASKASDFGGFVELLGEQYQLPRLFAYAAFLLPSIETLLGLTLLLGFRVREALWASIVMLAGFCLLIGYGLLGGNLESCGCLGSFSDLSPPLAIFRNIGCMLAAYCALRFEPFQPQFNPWKGWLIGSACVLVALATGTSREKPHFQTPTLIYGQPLPQLGVDIPELSQGSVALIVFHAGCSKCWDAMPQIQTFQNEPRLKLVGLTPSSGDELKIFQDTLQPPFPIYSISQETYEALDQKIPAILLVHNGILRAHLEGRMPSLASIQHFSKDWFDKFLNGQALP